MNTNLTPREEAASRSRRAFLKQAFVSIGFAGAALPTLRGATVPSDAEEAYARSRRESLPGQIAQYENLPDRYKDKFKITRLETLLVKPRWLFLKVHTDQGIVGLGEPVLEGRAKSCAQAVEEIAPYLIGKDPRRVVHHWQAIYRHAFYRGGPILTSALSGIEQALWDIKGKALGVPIYEMLGGPTRNRIRVYAHARSPKALKEKKAQGFTAFKTGVHNRLNSGIVASPEFIEEAADAFAALRKAGGDGVDIGIDFHGAISPQTPSSSSRRSNPSNRCSSRSRSNASTWTPWLTLPAAPTCPSPPGSGSSPNGRFVTSWKSGRQASCNPTSAMRAVFSSAASLRAWPKPTTPRSPHTIRSAPSPWRPASSLPRPSRISSARNRSAWVRAT
jgi:hypothetical protein